MENEKKVVKLDEGKLEQVSGGWEHGCMPYNDCPGYQELLNIKNSDGECDFKESLTRMRNNRCPRLAERFDCHDCPVDYEWLWEYGE